jgi:hypothetical protein
MPVVYANTNDVFRYHKTEPGDQLKYEALRSAAKVFAEVILENTPKCADQQAAIRHVREAVMTANASITLKGIV